MIAVDSSALLAILLQEPDAETFAEQLWTHGDVLFSAAGYLETGIVLDSRSGPAVSASLDALIDEVGMVVSPVDLQQARVAREAYRTYGRRNHPASLNLGDCFAYALAKVTRRPLLYKGDDFSKTDLVSVL